MMNRARSPGVAIISLARPFPVYPPLPFSSLSLLRGRNEENTFNAVDATQRLTELPAESAELQRDV